MSLKSHLKRTAIAGLVVAVTAPAVVAEDVLFWSRQGGQVEEVQKIRDSVLPNDAVEIEFISPDVGPWFTRLEAELETGEGTIGVLGALHGDLSSLDTAGLVDLSDLDLGDVTPAPAFMELGKLGTDQQLYLPWMQATYVMAANKDALQYLPEGADVMSLSYAQLIDWAKNMQAVDGTPRFGFPAGPNGLKHRFFQGYLYPSFTDSMVTEFRSDAAVAAGETFKELWEYTNPASTSYDFMQDPLLAGDVWVAFDHTARIGDALNDESGNFIAFPAPAGPTGRGFMPVLAGLAIPTSAPDMDAAKAAITHMMQRDTQLNVLAAVNFFPTVDAEVGEGSSMAA
ncbi:MAG: extracellular solute-binding protein [Litoreibacter sp.]|nr:extracellular solute-binding protein [Litoreibacter sp.]